MSKAESTLPDDGYSSTNYQVAIALPRWMMQREFSSVRLYFTYLDDNAVGFFKPIFVITSSEIISVISITYKSTKNWTNDSKFVHLIDVIWWFCRLRRKKKRNKRSQSLFKRNKKLMIHTHFSLPHFFSCAYKWGGKKILDRIKASPSKYLLPNHHRRWRKTVIITTNGLWNWCSSITTK